MATSAAIIPPIVPPIVPHSFPHAHSFPHSHTHPLVHVSPVAASSSPPRSFPSSFPLSHPFSPPPLLSSSSSTTSSSSSSSSSSSTFSESTSTPPDLSYSLVPASSSSSTTSVKIKVKWPWESTDEKENQLWLRGIKGVHSLVEHAPVPIVMTWYDHTFVVKPFYRSSSSPSEEDLHRMAFHACPDAVVPVMGSTSLTELTRQWWWTHLRTWCHSKSIQLQKLEAATDQIDNLTKALTHDPTTMGGGEWRFLWLPFMPGRSLWQFLNHHAPTLVQEDWSCILMQIIVFLVRMDKAHPGWCHGDLHLSNFVIDECTKSREFLFVLSTGQIIKVAILPFFKSLCLRTIDFDPNTQLASLAALSVSSTVTAAAVAAPPPPPAMGAGSTTRAISITRKCTYGVNRDMEKLCELILSHFASSLSSQPTVADFLKKVVEHGVRSGSDYDLVDYLTHPLFHVQYIL